MAKIFQSLKFQCTLYHAFENRLLTFLRKHCLYHIHPDSILGSVLCVVRLVNKILTGILRLIATSHANLTCEKDLICSFLFSYDEEVTKRKRKCVFGYFAATEACNSLVFASSRSSEMSILCSSLIALMALSFSPPLMKSVCFCSTGLYPFLI